MNYQPTRREFLKTSAATICSSSLLGTTALASIDPNSYSGRIFHATHFGPFEAVVRNGKLVGITPMIELDARPTEMLSDGVVDRTYDKSRVDYADMSPGEKMFFERCTVCHAPREVTHYTQQQWRGIVPSMFERAGFDDTERELVMDYLMKNAADAN